MTPSTQYQLKQNNTSDRINPEDASISFVAEKILGVSSYASYSKFPDSANPRKLVTRSASPMSFTDIGAQSSRLTKCLFTSEFTASFINLLFPSQGILVEEFVVSQIVSSFRSLLIPGEANENILYAWSEEIVQWASDDKDSKHEILSLFLGLMPDRSKHILLSTLCDYEFSTSSLSLINTVSAFLDTDCKRLAQASASFLCSCSGSTGIGVIDMFIKNKRVKHVDLVLGIVTILAREVPRC